MAISIENLARIGRKWPYSPKTRRGLDENGHIHRKPAGDWMKMAISTGNPARIGGIWPYPPKTRRGLDENGHVYRKPGGDWTKMAISIENPAGIGFNMNTAIESLPGIGFHTFSEITFWARMGFTYPHAGLYLFYIGMQMARTEVNVSRKESRATRGMRSTVCARQSFTLRFPSLAHSPSPSYC